MAIEEQEIRSGTLDQLSETITDADKAEALHTVRSAPDVCFTWDYGRSRPHLGKLYEKAKTSMWNVSTDIDWDIDVDPAKIARDPTNPLMTTLSIDRAGTVLESLSDDEWYDLGAAQQAWTLSQFMHGEQGALICTAQIVETVPWIDAKYYAATQVMDEARHVEVYGRYLTDKLGQEFPVNLHLRSLLDDVVAEPRWDMTYLGMQIMVEGLALAAFGFQYTYSIDPLLKQINAHATDGSSQKLHTSLALLPVDPTQVDYLYGRLLDAEPLTKNGYKLALAASLLRDAIRELATD